MAESYDTWAVVVFQQDGGWQVAQLPPALAGDLDGVVAALRGQHSGAFALLDIADEFFVAVRVVGGQEQYLLSDAGAATEWELAAEVMDRLDLDIPGDAESEALWPAGALGIFDDLGMDAHELSAILDNDDLYADELIGAVADRLGFGVEFEGALATLVLEREQ